MRKALLTVALLLSGCLQAVDISKQHLDAAQQAPSDGSTNPASDASTTPGLDASTTPGADASTTLSDGGTTRPDGSVVGCASDLNCPTYQICVADCALHKRCIDGCRDSSQCPAGKVCENVVDTCGESYGSCVASPTCTQESDCPVGSACDFIAAGSGQKKCLPGCHLDTNCPAGDKCLMPACPKCANCPCLGVCTPPVKTCSADSDCPAGQACGLTPQDCTIHCQVGCHNDTECRPDQQCLLPGCASVCCDIGVCAPRATTCTSDGECGAGQICMDCGLGNQCIAGCHTASQCGPDEQCSQVVCAGFCCPDVCTPKPATCESDGECGVGAICTYTDIMNCSGTKTCQAGCRDDTQCAGGTCQKASCGACCPGVCTVPASCTDDSQCAAGSVCEFGAGCYGPKSCVPGCHKDAQCGSSQTCFLGSACWTCPCPGTCQSSTCPSSSTCATTLGCTWEQSHCDNACCTACAQPPPPSCSGTKGCAQEQGYDVDGCKVAEACGACCMCPALAEPVCATNYQTYGSPCELSCAGATTLHAGACQGFEGLGCGFNTGGPTGPCAAGQYCRVTCPYCNSIQPSRCTMNGACTEAYDCPAGLTATCAPGKKPSWTCAVNVCEYTCL